jgi:hypothetical protein
MANFAQLDENNVVIRSIVIDEKDCCDYLGVESEDIGIALCKKLVGANTNWKKTCLNGNIRFRCANIGYTYDAQLDAFIAPQPHPSWILDANTTDWVSPLGAAPDLTEEEIANKNYYRWDEDAYQADNTSGWVLDIFK